MFFLKLGTVWIKLCFSLKCMQFCINGLVCNCVRRRLLQDDAAFYVPEVIDNLSTGQILTSELVSGVPLDQCVQYDQATRNYVSAS